MRASILSLMASTAILVTISLLFPSHSIASPACEGSNGTDIAQADYPLPFTKTSLLVKQTKRVTYKILDLSLPNDMSSLHVRMRSAVKQVCAPPGFSRAEKLDIARCEVEAMARAQESLRLKRNQPVTAGNGSHR